MCLSLETLRPIIRTGLPILVEPIDLVISVIISNDVTQMVNFPTPIPYCNSHSSALLDLFHSTDISIVTLVIQRIFLHWEILKMLLSKIPLTFYHIHNEMPISSHCLWLFLCRLGRLCDHLRDVSWEDIFKVSASADASEFCE